MTTVDKDVEDAQVDLPSPAVQHAPAVAATTCSSQWRCDARVLGSPPFRTLGSLGTLPSFLCATHAVLRVLLLAAVGTRSLWVASPIVMSQPPLTPGRF